MRPLLALSALLLSALASTALAKEIPFSQPALDKLQAAGQPVAVVFHAPWCPTCRAQAPVLKDIADSSEFKDLTVLVADFDSEKSLKKALNVAAQSTIVVFRGGKEVARATGQTDREHLVSLLHVALAPGG